METYEISDWAREKLYIIIYSEAARSSNLDALYKILQRTFSTKEPS